MTEKEYAIVTRMWEKGDYIVQGASGNHFWANTSVRGCLIEAASSDEVALVQKFANEGKHGMIKETRYIKTYTDEGNLH